MISSPTLALERRLFLFAPSGLVAALALAALVLAAAVAGKGAVTRTIATQDAFQTEGTAALDEWRTALAEIERTGEAPGPYVARPMSILLPAVLPPAPLGDFAAAGSNLHPTTTTISGWANPADLFAEYEFENPTPASLGGLDITFLVVALMPLIMIAVSFDVLAGDRARGRARLVAAQAGHVHMAVWERLIVRNAALWAAFAIAALLAAVVTPPCAALGPRLLAFGAWLAVALVYGLFWFGLIALAGVLSKAAEAVAASLFAAWAVLVFAVPAIGGALAEGLYPPPSRLAFLSEMREGEVAAVRETAQLTAGFLADHPEMTVSDDAVPGYYRSTFLANREAGRRTTPVLDAFNASRADRTRLVGALQYLSPPMIADRALTAIAGGDVTRAMMFQDQARDALQDLHARIGPAVVAKQRISLADFDAIKRFAFQDRTLGQTLIKRAAPLGFLLTLVGGLLWFARKRMRAPLERLL